MRRFSQRSHLVTLSEINITPLLDLAFVLLIIFVITTPLLEQSLKLNLPGGGQEEKNPQIKEDRRTVEISPQGFYHLDGTKMTLNEVERGLVKAHQTNPKLGVVIRADTKEQVGNLTAVLDVCERNGIFRIGIATRNEKK
jgi:biopolymer transport protein ExbD